MAMIMFLHPLLTKKLESFLKSIKYSYLGKLQFVCSWKSSLNDLDGYGRNGYAILYECTALTS